MNALTVLLCQSFLYLVWYTTMSILGHYNNFFFAAHLLDIAMGFKTLRTILSSVTHNGKQVRSFWTFRCTTCPWTFGFKLSAPPGFVTSADWRCKSTFNVTSVSGGRNAPKCQDHQDLAWSRKPGCLWADQSSCQSR